MVEKKIWVEVLVLGAGGTRPVKALIPWIALLTPAKANEVFRVCFC